jgi:signal transduction histidine kinase
LHEAAGRQRPWHRALIAERAARFYLAHQLDWAYPTLRPQPDATAGDGPGQPADLADRRSAVTTGTVDLLGILSGSQVLSSETSIQRLPARVVEVLSALTGATGVRLLLASGDGHDWLLPAPGSGGNVPVGGTGGERAVPMSVLRYAQRMREPLVVDDATRDDLDMRAEGRLPENVEVSAYYVVAEALTNTAKHARASAVSVKVEVVGEVLRVAVRDDGAGGAALAQGTGLADLKDRVEALGGRIFLDSPPGAGTSLRAEFPLTATDGGVTSR